MRKFILPFLSLAFASGAMAESSGEDKLVLEWTCKSSAFYQIKVKPDGSYEPASEAATNLEPLKIRVFEAGETTKAYCGWDDPLHFYIKAADSCLIVCSSDPCRGQINTEHSDDRSHELDRFSANIKEWHPISIVIHREDNDWRFTVVDSHLFTTKEAREANIRSKSPSVHFEAEAGMSMFVGECLLTKGKP